MNEYTATNGVRIEYAGAEDGFQAWNIGGHERALFTPAEWHALREYFRADA